MNLLERIWRWYGKRRGWLDTSSGIIALPAKKIGNLYVWRGDDVSQVKTITLVARDLSSLNGWNRTLTDGELRSIRDSIGSPLFPAPALSTSPQPTP